MNAPNYEGPLSITEQDLPDLIDLLNQVFRPDGGDMSREYPRHVCLDNRDNVRVIKENERILSHVATSIRPVSLGGIPTKEAGIGAVATHTDGRGKQYASILMKDAIARSVEQGADIMLISGNLGIYRRLDAVACGSFPIVRLAKSDAGHFPNFALRQATEKDIETIAALRETQPTRYQLPLEDIKALFDCKWIMDKPSDWWMIEYEGEPVGFAVVHFSGSELTIMDWAGRVESLEASSLLFGQYDVETISFTAVSESILPLSWKPFIKERCCFGYDDGTVLVINAKRFLDRAQSFFIERVDEQAISQLKIEAAEQSAAFTFEGETLKFENGGELAHLFFGHPTEDILIKKQPSDTPLTQLLRRLFPVPLVWYGIGYV